MSLCHEEADSGCGWLQEIIDELKTADVVLPLVTDGNRDLLKELEQAGVEFIGTQYEAGELASHKHQCVPGTAHDCSCGNLKSQC